MGNQEQQQRLLSDCESVDLAKGAQWRDELSRRKTHTIHLLLLYSTVAILSVLLVASVRRPCSDPNLFTYSAANSAIEYEEVCFKDMPSQNVSPYLSIEPTDEIDALWNDLYDGTGFTVFTPEETRKMPNRTVAVPGPGGDSGIYQLEVFHELHCLNALRKALWPDRYPDYRYIHPNGTRDAVLSLHHNHCIDRLRMGVQCASNIGANYQWWDENAQRWKLDMRTTHTCRNFERVQAWARSRDSKSWSPFTPSHLTGS